MGNAASTPPSGSQFGLARASLSCEATAADNLLTTTAQLNLSALTPLSGGAGYKASFNDINGAISVPYDAEQAKSVGSTSYAANITIVLGVTKATQSTLTYTQNVTGSWDGKPIPVPADGGVISPFEPVTLDSGADGQVADLTIVSASFSLRFFDAQGNALYQGVVLDLLCRPVAPGPIQSLYQPVIASTAITNSTVDQSYSLGVRASFPDSAVSTKSTIANIPVSCVGVNFGTGTTISYVLQGTAPSFLSNGYAFELSNTGIFLTIDGGIAGAFVGFYGDDEGSAFVDLINGAPSAALTLDNVTPSSLDLSRDFSAATDPNTPRPLNTGNYVRRGYKGPILFALPKFGSLFFNNITAGEVGTIFGASSQRLNYRESIYGRNGALAASDGIRCTSNGPNSLFRAPILAV